MNAPPTPRPMLLLAELTYRCPLHCPYCSNPSQYPGGATELTTEEWGRVLREAAEIGVLHVGLSGGEPLLRPDLLEIVSAARSAGLYSNLITSAVGLSADKAAALKRAGLDSVQISFQSDSAELADSIAGARAHQKKLDAAAAVLAAGLPLSLNVVLHRYNIARLSQMIDFAESLGAARLELANTQFYGWAYQNRSSLLPTRAQLQGCADLAAAARERLKGKMEVVYVLPDYFGDRPKPCMAGWGQRYLTVNPIGSVLPCPTAGEIPDMTFATVRDHPLSWIWRSSDAFQRFRGTEWMPEPCKNCEFHTVDFGGCRCQAALLTGDAALTDPVCALSPHHELVTSIVKNSNAESTGTVPLDLADLRFRQNPHNTDASRIAS